MKIVFNVGAKLVKQLQYELPSQQIHQLCQPIWQLLKKLPTFKRI